MLTVQEITVMLNNLEAHLEAHRLRVHHNDPLATCGTCANLCGTIHNLKEAEAHLTSKTTKTR